MKRVAYITLPSFFDLDISLINAMSELVCVTPIMIVTGRNNHLSAFDLGDVGKKVRLAHFRDIPELSKYTGAINLDQWMIALNPTDSFWGNIILVLKIIHYIVKEHVELIHTTSDCRAMLMMLPFVAFRKHSILTVHDPIPHELGNRVTEYVKRNIGFKVYKNVLLLSHSLEREFIDRYCNSRRGKKVNIFYSRLGVYDFLKTLTLEDNQYGQYILFSGRISYYKGVDLLIDSYLLSDAPGKGIKLIIAGAGDINKNTGSDNIILINRYLKNEELASLIRHCEFVVLPYRTATQSGVLMSAFAFNKPALVTATGDLPMSVSDGIHGVVVSPDSVDSLTFGINRMLDSDLNIMSEHIKESYNNMQGDNSWYSIARELYAVYERI